jgi:hypothetical protein
VSDDSGERSVGALVAEQVCLEACRLARTEGGEGARVTWAHLKRAITTTIDAVRGARPPTRVLCLVSLNGAGVTIRAAARNVPAGRKRSTKPGLAKVVPIRRGSNG